MHEIDDGNEWQSGPSRCCSDAEHGRRRGRQEQMITARQKILIESSWELMRPMGVHVSDLFYDRLFELDPFLEALFPDDLTAQRPGFMNAVGAAVLGLGDSDTMRLSLLEMARRNLSHGIRPGHYVTFGEALLWTFEQSLAGDFTPPVREAWAAFYADVSGAMLQAAEAREGQKPR
jgi:methyl-accepting chemotaxis protein